MRILDYKTISEMEISPEEVYQWCLEAWKLKEECILPPKVKMWQGKEGRYITMPCVIPSIDVAGVKFISRNVDNVMAPPARNSNIMIQKCSELGLLAVLDGIWITNMRTGAIAAHSVIEYSRNDMETLGIMGLGNAARAFIRVFGSVYKKNLTVRLYRYKDQAEKFIERFGDEFPHFSFEICDELDAIFSCDSIVSAISYADKPFIESADVFKPGTTIVPIHTAGFQPCDISFDKVIIDDHGHVQSFQHYNEFKERAVEISHVVSGKATGRKDDNERIIAYCGGIALHDIYIAYKVYDLSYKLSVHVDDVDMFVPSGRYWI